MPVPVAGAEGREAGALDQKAVWRDLDRPSRLRLAGERHASHVYDHLDSAPAVAEDAPLRLAIGRQKFVPFQAHACGDLVQGRKDLVRILEEAVGRHESFGPPTVA